ncbi:hypothetical protein K438DRAFT_242041 [Mycena galopus ATCC 62051]|nr:hypothetical protein K438DRAFT_242041 [Mycena galopus ATCC 62051]
MFSVSQALPVALLLVSSVAGQATTLPQCVIGCARADAIEAGCALTDTACLCKTSFAANVIQCSETTSCSMAEQAQVSAILTEMCAAGASSASNGVGASVTYSPAGVASSTRWE